MKKTTFLNLLNKQKALLILFYLSVQFTHAATWYVNDNATAGDIYCSAVGNNANSGLTAALPKLTLAAAITAATAGDTIYVDTGSFTGQTHVISKSLTIIGAGIANTKYLGNNLIGIFANITANNVTIKGLYIEKYFLDSSSSGQVINISGGRTGILLESLLITKSLGGGSTLPNINIAGGSNVTIKKLFFKCSGYNGGTGGGVLVNASILNIENSVFFQNENVNGFGGAINIIGASTVNVTGCTFEDNHGKAGGAIALTTGTLTVNNSCFNGNNIVGSTPTSGEGGGAFVLVSGLATFNNCSFTNNCIGASGVCATSNAPRGGAIFVKAGTLNLNTCEFQNNIAGNRPGMGFDVHLRVSGTLNLNNVFFRSIYSGTNVNVGNESGLAVNWTNSGTPTTGTGTALSAPETAGTISSTNNTAPSGTVVTNCITTSSISDCSTTVNCATTNIKPVIFSCVEDKTITDCSGSLPNYTSQVSAFSDCNLTVTQSPAPGTLLSTLGNGVHIITMTVSDQSPNSPDATCTFELTLSGCVASCGTCGASSTWDGSTWSNGKPTLSTPAIFTGNFTATEDLVACSVQVTNNANVIVGLDFNYTVCGVVTVDTGSTLTFNNNSNLFQETDVTNVGTINMKRNTNPLKRLDYTIWSAPVSSQNLLAFSPATLTNRFYAYNTTTNLYNAVNPASTTFGQGIGYQIRTPNNHPTTPTTWTGTFTGIPNNGPYTTTLTNIGVGQRFNLVGNPYPSPIDMELFVTENTANITGTLYFWRKTNSTITSNVWSTWNGGTFTAANEDYVSDPNGIIRNGQGFFVEASATGTSISFDNSMRVADNSNQFFRTNTNTIATSMPIEKHRIWLNVTNSNGNFFQQAVSYIQGGTLNVDNYDAKNISNSAMLFTSSIPNSTDTYVIQSRPLPFDSNDMVPLNFRTDTPGNYSISIYNKDGLFAGNTQDIFILDKYNNTFNNINNGSYNFASEAGNFTNRFELRYNTTSLSVIDNTFNNGIIAYQENGSILINSSNEILKNVKVFDIRGRLLLDKNQINAKDVTLDLASDNDILLLKITSESGQISNIKIIN